MSGCPVKPLTCEKDPDTPGQGCPGCPVTLPVVQPLSAGVAERANGAALLRRPTRERSERQKRPPEGAVHIVAGA